MLIYLLRLNILHIYFLIKWLVVYKCDYRFHIKQVIISCEFCQHFKYLEVLQCSWICEWFMFLNDLGYYVDISIEIKYFTYILFDQMVGCIQM